MATFVEAVLPSGRGIRLAKLSTPQFRAAQDRATSKVGDVTGNKLAMALGHEMLLAGFVAVTADALAWSPSEESPDVDAMLSSVPPEAWVKPTFEELIIRDGSRSLDVLLEDVADYMSALNLVQDVTMPNRGRLGALGKKRMVSGAP